MEIHDYTSIQQNKKSTTIKKLKNNYFFFQLDNMFVEVFVAARLQIRRLNTMIIVSDVVKESLVKYVLEFAVRVLQVRVAFSFRHLIARQIHYGRCELYIFIFV